MLIGVDIGGTKTLVTAAGRDLAIHNRLKRPTDRKQGQELAWLIDAIRQVADGEKIEAIGVASPGPIDFKSGTILTPPNLPWHNLPIRKELEKALGVPVVLENDANSAGLSEAVSGAGQGYEHVLYVTISTGIGTGLINRGQIYHGAYDTEGGHITLRENGADCGCGGKGHFESEISGHAIMRRFGKEAYAITDPATWEEIAHDIALGLASLSAMTSPDCIVLGGGVSVHFKKFVEPLRRHFEQSACHLYPRPVIKQAKRVEEAAVIGALLLARDA